MGWSIYVFFNRKRVSAIQNSLKKKKKTNNYVKFDPEYSVTYLLVDLMGEPGTGKFYKQDLLKTDQTVFRIEKVIRRDPKKKRIALVKWSGYPDKFSSRVKTNELKNLV